MIELNNIKIELTSYDTINIEGIEFNNSAFIQVLVDGKNLIKEDPNFESSLLVFNELIKSSKETGKYLLFTSTNGVADAGGWDLIRVDHNSENIMWTIERDEQSLIFNFDKDDFIQQVRKLINKVETLDSKYTLEPSFVLFPE